ncbi:MAG: glycoside hydrolase family 3 protein, partial [bacterium]
ELGDRNDFNLACEYGQKVADELSAAGFNLNFAPVLDLDTNPRNPIIGDRSLGADPERVGELGAAFALGMQSRGVIAVGKHFPGHGDTDHDSHFRLPEVSASAETLTGRELVPFKRAVSRGIAGIMISHVLYPAWDRENPATTSPRIINILKGDLNFSGVIFSDDFEMEALDQNNLGEKAVQAVQAGIDQILVCKTAEKQVEVFEALVKAVEKGVISQARLESAGRNITALKRQYIV